MASNTDIVRGVFDAFSRRDLAALRDLADPGIVFVPPTGRLAGRTEPYRGHDGMRQYFRDVAAVWEELRLSPRDFRASGDRILVTGRVSARSRSRTVSGSTGWIWRVRDGKVTYVRVYSSAADAIAALEEE